MSNYICFTDTIINEEGEEVQCAKVVLDGQFTREELAEVIERLFRFELGILVAQRDDALYVANKFLENRSTRSVADAQELFDKPLTQVASENT